MDKTIEVYNIIKAIKNGEISDDVAQIRILRLFVVKEKSDALFELLDFVAEICPDDKIKELNDILERI